MEKKEEHSRIYSGTTVGVLGRRGFDTSNQVCKPLLKRKEHRAASTATSSPVRHQPFENQNFASEGHSHLHGIT